MSKCACRNRSLIACGCSRQCFAGNSRGYWKKSSRTGSMSFGTASRRGVARQDNERCQTGCLRSLVEHDHPIRSILIMPETTAGLWLR